MNIKDMSRKLRTAAEALDALVATEDTPAKARAVAKTLHWTQRKDPATRRKLRANAARMRKARNAKARAALAGLAAKALREAPTAGRRAGR